MSVCRVGAVGIKAQLYFEVVSTLALVAGLVMVHVIQPGAGININANTLDTKGFATYTSATETQNVVDFLFNIVSSSIIKFIVYIKDELLSC